MFLADEPTTHRHAPNPVVFSSQASFYIKSLARKGLSFISRDECSKDLLGFIFTLDMAEDPREEGPSMVAFLPYFRETVAMIDELENFYLNIASLSPGQCCTYFR